MVVLGAIKPGESGDADHTATAVMPMSHLERQQVRREPHRMRGLHERSLEDQGGIDVAGDALAIHSQLHKFVVSRCLPTGELENWSAGQLCKGTDVPGEITDAVFRYEEDWPKSWKPLALSFTKARLKQLTEGIQSIDLCTSKAVLDARNAPTPRLKSLTLMRMPGPPTVHTSFDYQYERILHYAASNDEEDDAPIPAGHVYSSLTSLRAVSRDTMEELVLVGLEQLLDGARVLANVRQCRSCVACQSEANVITSGVGTSIPNCLRDNLRSAHSTTAYSDYFLDTIDNGHKSEFAVTLSHGHTRVVERCFEVIDPIDGAPSHIVSPCILSQFLHRIPPPIPRRSGCTAGLLLDGAVVGLLGFPQEYALHALQQLSCSISSAPSISCSTSRKPLPYTITWHQLTTQRVPSDREYQKGENNGLVMLSLVGLI
ncbi:hypothetical protein OE88DRAFT_1646238 [Heliocybe sulcata]|uniref:Uncharacterized protein n=1 Tax=Heliocybe sulcata TaxID=5364 RepID=A0A5C3MY74_9AGAM|nr:hypothetical protein OE88DRAFT_1646238 [Heliocybe sulcata]